MSEKKEIKITAAGGRPGCLLGEMAATFEV